MNEFFIGELIRQRRKDMKMTQADLAKTICDAEVISRLERGEHIPSRERLSSILQQLDLPEDRFYAMLSKNEAEARRLQREIRADVISFEQASEAERPRIRERAMEMLEELERLLNPRDLVTHQFICSEKVTLGKPEGPYSPEERIALLTEAIRMTVPDFDPERILYRRYTVNETTLINQIACTYASMEQIKKAIGIYSQLLEYLDRHTQELSSHVNQFCLVAYNYAICLTKDKQYQAAIELSERSWKICNRHRSRNFLPGFLAILAECYFFTGKTEESRKLYLQVDILYGVFENTCDQAIIRKEMKARLDLDPLF